MAISDEYLRLVKQHIIDVRIKYTVYDSNNNVLDELIGIVDGGSINIDSSSDVRRTSSITLTPTKQITNLNEKSLIWLNKTVKIQVGILDQRTKNRTWFSAGSYFYQDASSSYDASTNTMSVNLGDWMLKLDGTINGQVGGVLSVVYVAYDEDAGSGRPISYTSIKKAIEDTLTQLAGMSPEEFSVCEIGEYYANPQYNEDWRTYRQKYPLWDKIPFDQEFSTGCTVWDIIKTLKDLYPNYDAAFNESGKFIVRMIPSEEKDEIVLPYHKYRDLVISESVNTDLTTIRNVCEVWGESMDVDWYQDGINRGANDNYIVTLDGYTKSTIYCTDSMESAYVTVDETKFKANFPQEGTYVFDYDGTNWKRNSHIVSLSALGIEIKNGSPIVGDTISVSHRYGYAVGQRFGFKFNQNTVAGQMMNINGIGQLRMRTMDNESLPTNFFKDLNDIQIFGMTQVSVNEQVYGTYTGSSTSFVSVLQELGETDTSPSHQKEIATFNGYTNYELTDEIVTGYLIDLAKHGMLIKYTEYEKQLLYLGVSQAHGIDVLTDGTIVPGGYTDSTGTYDLWSLNYYKHILNCDNVHFTVKADSPFTVQKLGNRIDVKSGGEFDNITSNELAIERAIYENWKNSRLTDNITITTKLMPFLDVYMKVTYKPQDSLTANQYMIQSVSHDLSQGISTITMYRFSPLYNTGAGYTDRMTYDEMSAFRYDDLTGDDDYVG